MGYGARDIRARVDRITVFHDRSDIGADNALTLRNVQRTHEGNYSCHVKNSLGSDEIVYTLQVQGTWSLVVWEENKIPSSGILRPSGSFGDNFSRYSIKEGIPSFFRAILENSTRVYVIFLSSL